MNTAALDFEHLKSHVSEKIKGAELEFSPFPHFTVDEFFPPDIYETIVRDNPFRTTAGVEWVTKGHMRRNRVTGPYNFRKQINFHKSEETKDIAHRAFWDRLAAVFLDDHWFARTIFDKFPQYFLIRFGDAVREPDFWDRFEKQLFLQRHEPGFTLGPHTDVPTRVFTCIFSFADGPGHEHYGTQLFRPKDPYVRCWGNGHYGFEDFELVRTIPYTPNRFFVFFKTRQSFHAVPEIARDIENQRFSMQFQLYEPAGGVFTDLSEPDMLVADHSNALGRLARWVTGRRD